MGTVFTDAMANADSVPLGGADSVPLLINMHAFGALKQFLANGISTSRFYVQALVTLLRRPLN